MPKYSFPPSSRREARVTTIVLIVTFVLMIILALASGCTPTSKERNEKRDNYTKSIITTDSVKGYHFKTNEISMKIIEFELHGHTYLSKAGYSSIVHAEHCPCKNTR